MSLLVPTAQDYKDARDGYERLPVYRQRLADTVAADGSKYRWEFEVQDGFFSQSSVHTDDVAFNYATHDFGVTKPWHELRAEVEQLNADADEFTAYKVLFLARHGQGFHNVIVARYGPAEWKRKWHALGRDGDIVYAPDPELTDVGVQQAQENHEAWRKQLENGCPLPTKYFASPLQRSCNTLRITMDGLRPDDSQVVVKENVREIIGFHLCNKRSTKTTILERFGRYNFVTEPGFAEDDELYTETEETFDDNCFRVNDFMQELFEDHQDQYVNVTSHGGTIKCFIAVVGHRPFTISTGGMIPIVVKGTKRH